MKKQERNIVIRIDQDLKNKFIDKASNNQMKISTRIKYLMKMDIDNKIIIKNG